MRPGVPLAMMALFLVGAASAARADEKSHRAAAEELLKVMNSEKNTQAAIDQMLAIQLKANPKLEPIKDVMKKFLTKYLGYSALKEDLISIYTSEFTEEELKGAVAFYSTPAGKKMAQKLPTLLQKGAELGAKRVQENSEELKQMIQEELKKER